jgi:hypothetical protein
MTMPRSNSLKAWCGLQPIRKIGSSFLQRKYRIRPTKAKSRQIVAIAASTKFRLPSCATNRESISEGTIKKRKMKSSTHWMSHGSLDGCVVSIRSLSWPAVMPSSRKDLSNGLRFHFNLIAFYARILASTLAILPNTEHVPCLIGLRNYRLRRLAREWWLLGTIHLRKSRMKHSSYSNKRWKLNHFEPSHTKIWRKYTIGLGSPSSRMSIAIRRSG